jgi:hypothetical protein
VHVFLCTPTKSAASAFSNDCQLCRSFSHSRHGQRGRAFQWRQLPGVPTDWSRAFGMQVMVTVEEGAIGGFAAHVLNFLINEGQLDGGSLKFRSMMLPDR